jgi:hypothetical protein
MTGLKAARCSNACFHISVLSCDDVIWDDVIVHVEDPVVCLNADFEKLYRRGGQALTTKLCNPVILLMTMIILSYSSVKRHHFHSPYFLVRRSTFR